MPRYVITGAPGTGKTALVTALTGRGTAVGEPARELIAEHRAATGAASLDHAPERFVDLLIARSIEKYEGVADDGVVFYDRGLPDCVAYAGIFGLNATGALEAAATRRYAEPVIMAPPWEDIYTTDDMRKATFDQVVAFHSVLVSAYDELGYELVELPEASIADRKQFVVDLLGL